MAAAGTDKTALEKIGEMQIGGDIGGDSAEVPTLQLSDQESQILELYDRLEEITQGISLLQAQDSISLEKYEVVDESELKKAQETLLEAKARYALRNSIIENVLIANPILKAVHAGLNATPIERDLLPLIQERDTLSISLTETAAKVLSIMEKLTKVEAEHILVARKNAELAKKMIALAEDADSQKDDIKDPEVRAQLDELEEAVKVSRQRWRIMKGTASAVVAGSGVDWARNPTLRELVLDDDGD